MAGKLPYIPFFTGDWMKDPAVSLCTPATRGVWIDLLCAMHDAGRSGELRGTLDQLARLARCSTADVAQALTDLQTTGAADVTERNSVVTVVNRRMQREAHKRVNTAKRQARFRESHAGNATISDSVSISDSKPNLPTNQNGSIDPDDSSGGRDGGDFSAGWGKVANRLAALGATQWRVAISEAKQCGCNPGLALTLIDYGVKHGYGVGAIICRLVKANPSLAVELGWPAAPEPPEKTVAQIDERRKQASDGLARGIIVSGRKAKKTEDEIKAELAEAGLEWPS